MRIGTIGTGEIVRSILRGVQKAQGATCGAVYSRSEEKGRALAGEFGVQTVYTELDALLHDPQLDWIYIASPNSLHYPQARAALLAGKNVLLEKPFASTHKEACALRELAQQKGLILCEAVTTEFLPNFRLLREQLPAIGRPRLVLCNYSQYSSRYDKLLRGERTNVFDPAFSGGALMDINYYNVRFVVSLFGAPERVDYAANLNGGIDTSGIALLQYKDFAAQCTGAKDTWGANTVELEGEGGYLIATGGSNALEMLSLTTRAGTQHFDEQHGRDRWEIEIEQLARLVAAGEREFFARQLEISVETVRTIEQLRRSAGIRFPADEQDETHL